MPFASLNGTSLYFEEHGNGPPVVLVHGMYGNHAAWYQQVEAFAPHFRTITLDLRGFGLSEDSNSLGSSAAVDDILGLLDHLGIDNAALIGQSMGGNACLAVAAQHPGRVSALVLAGSLGGVVLPEQLRTRQAELAASIKDISLSQRMLSASFLEREGARSELFLQLVSFNKGASTYFTLGTRAPAPSLAVLQDVASRLPVLLLVGDQDAVQPPEIVEAVAGSISDLELAVIADSGHSAYFEQPQVFNAQVQQFIERVLSAQPSVGSAAV
jgi:3-oxoadipate enol-lactonase